MNNSNIIFEVFFLLSCNDTMHMKVKYSSIMFVNKVDMH
jgi:hypothetical protein